MRERTSRKKILASRMPLSGDLWDTYFEHLKLTFPSPWASFSAWRPSPARDLPRPAQSRPAPAPVQATPLSSCLVWKLPDPFPQPRWASTPTPAAHHTTCYSQERLSKTSPAPCHLCPHPPTASAAPGEMRALRPTAGSHLGHPPQPLLELPPPATLSTLQFLTVLPRSLSYSVPSPGMLTPTPLSWPSPF